jgi:hypothetical protein
MVNVIAKYYVTYDSRGGKNPNAFCVHKENGVIRKFQQSKRGLFYIDTADMKDHVVLVTTIANNKSITIRIDTTPSPSWRVKHRYSWAVRS